VFGPTRLTTAELDVLDALAAHRDVHLWLQHPSPALWAAVADRLAAAPPTSRLRADDLTGPTGPTGPTGRPRPTGPTGELARMPLLGSLGRDARELQVRLTALPAVGAGSDRHHPLPTRPPTLLGRLQDALAADAEPPALALGADDYSVQVHACHGLPRQVEVLRELLVGLLADDPTLEPRDVVVMCPDVERAAPLVAAAFGRSAAAAEPLGHPGQRIRVKVADRSLLQVNPLLSLLGHLLDLAGARCTLDEVLGLVAQPPVRRRFALRDADLEQLDRWLPEVGVRWGLDVAHRARHGLPGVADNTWQEGLDRLLLGVAMTEDGLPLVGGVLPHDDVASQRAELAGRLAEIVERLAVVLDALRDPQPLSAWAAGLDQALDLLADAAPDDDWQDAAARRVLTEVLDEAGDTAATTVLCLADVQALLADRLAGRPTRASFRTGDLTVCSLAPMRSVPHRVVVLLGLDDDAFPRTGTVRGDDVLVRRPFVGDRDARSEDRQILLDAVHAATERLVVLCTGMNPRTNAVEPPAVPVGELLDTLRRMVAAADHDRLVVRHCLQPFDERNLVVTGDRPRVSARPRPLSYDPAMLAAAAAARGGRRPAIEIRDLRLPPAPPEPEIRLDELVAMLVHPAKAFLKQRLGMRPPDEDRPPAQRVALSLDNLERWAVGDRLVEQIRLGRETAAARAELARMLLPYGRLGSRELAEILTAARGVAGVAPPPSRSETVARAPLPDGRVVTGRLPDVSGDTIVTVVYSRLSARYRLRAWVRLLVAAAGGDRPWQSLLAGRGGPGRPPEQQRWGPLDPAAARLLLADLVAVRDAGLTQVLPVPAATAEAYVRSARGRATAAAARGAAAAARREWARDFGDASDRVNALVWGPDAPLDRLLDVAAPGPLTSGHPHWFADLAHRIWLPIVQPGALPAAP
jgi:exodeoxyribonuclease V gamma subunit